MNDLIQMLVLSAVAISCGLLGPFLVLKRMVMFANSLSHTILLGLALAFLCTGAPLFSLPTLLIGALIAAFFTAFLTEGLVRLFRLQEDASIGLVFTALFALGITVVSISLRDVHLGVESVMGNADVLQVQDLQMTAGLVCINLVAILLFYRNLQLASFDPNLAKCLGLRGNLMHFLLLFLSALSCIGAFRAVGVLLVLAFLVGPFLTARIFCHRLPWLLFWAPLIGVLAAVFGVITSRLFFEFCSLSLSTSGIVTIWIGLFYCFAKCFSFVKLSSCKKELPS